MALCDSLCLVRLSHGRPKKNGVRLVRNRDVLSLFLPLWTSLQVLNISYRGIQSLPVNIGNLGSLKYLNAEGNQLEELPPSFSKLRQLTRCNFSENLFESLPPCFLDSHSNSLPNLKIVYFENNLFDLSLAEREQIPTRLFLYASKASFVFDREVSEVRRSYVLGQCSASSTTMAVFRRSEFLGVIASFLGKKDGMVLPFRQG